MMNFKIYITLFISLSLNIFCNNLSFTIIIPSYNNELYCIENLYSVFNQNCKSDWKVIYIDDGSTDKTLELVEKYICYLDKQSNIKLIKNKKRVGALENIYNAVHSCSDQDIIVLLDGDDFFANSNVLEILEKIYEDKNIWMTYGQYAYWPGNNIGICEAIPDEIVTNNDFRNYKWVTSHLRTFKASLFKKIKVEDLLYGDIFYPMAWDIAIMYPMLEMASNRHIKYIPEILYLYNYQNPICDHNVNRNLQVKLNSLILQKNKYSPLESLD